MFLYLGDHLRMLGSNVWERFGPNAKIENEVTTPGGIQHTIRHRMMIRLAADDVTRVCDEVVVLNRFSQGIIWKWFEMGIFRVPRTLRCNTTLTILEIALFAVVDWNATVVESISFDYEYLKFIFIPAVTGVTRVLVDGTEVFNGVTTRYVQYILRNSQIAACLVFFR